MSVCSPSTEGHSALLSGKLHTKNLPPSDRCWTRQSVTHSQRAAYSFWAWDKKKKMETTQCPKDWKIVARDCASKRRRTTEERGDNFPWGGYVTNNIFFCANDVSALRPGFITVHIKSKPGSTAISFTKEMWLYKTCAGLHYLTMISLICAACSSFLAPAECRHTLNSRDSSFEAQGCGAFLLFPCKPLSHSPTMG